jgi:arginase family enzyme
LKPERFVEFGIQDHCNSKPLWDYVRAKKVRVVPWTELRGKVIGKTWAAELSKLASKSDGVVVSFDLDAIASVYAPGVSAPQAEGLTSSDAIEMCEIAGKHPAVKSLGLFELNPDFDQDGRTARLAATMAWHFLAAKMGGLSNSGGGKSKK